MNDGLSSRVVCPYYLRHGRRENMYSVSCEFIMDSKKLGFRPELKVGFVKREDFVDYVEIFCCDRCETCPVYKAITKERYNG